MEIERQEFRKPAARAKVRFIGRLQEKGAMHLNCNLSGEHILTLNTHELNRSNEAFTKFLLSNFW